MGFNAANVPTDEAKGTLPDDLEYPPQTVLDKTVIFFHNESTFQDQSTFWGKKGKHIKPKGKGTVITVSDFIDETNGYLAQTKKKSVYSPIYTGS